MKRYGSRDKNPTDPEQYVNENAETLSRTIKHSSSTFPRALAFAALIEYGDDPAVASVVEDLERLRYHHDEY
jgi:hypothetical protein